MNILSIQDAAFAPFGRAVSGVPLDALLSALEGLPLPDAGMAYQPREERLHALTGFEPFGERLFADLPYQLGWCAGANHQADCLVRHGGSAFIAGLSDFALTVSPRWVVSPQTFRIPARTLVEIYGDTLRSAPLGTDFRVLALLPYATNTAFSPSGAMDETLYARNTWRVPLASQP